MEGDEQEEEVGCGRVATAGNIKPDCTVIERVALVPGSKSTDADYSLRHDTDALLLTGCTEQKRWASHIAGDHGIQVAQPVHVPMYLLALDLFPIQSAIW